LGTSELEIAKKLDAYQTSLKDKVLGTVDEIKKNHPNEYDLR
jgi:5-(carboxyamino)imidazole ribonucleotide mutase